MLVTDLVAVEQHLEEVASRSPTFTIHLRGTGTFRPLAPVVFLSLSEGISGCDALQRRLRTGPLDLELTYPYHPHVTVAHHLSDEVLDEAFESLVDFEATFLADRFDFYEQDAEGTWLTRRSFSLADQRR
jgi:2'-5' RNA ligase